MAIPPGIRYLAQRIPFFFSGPVVTYLLLRLAERHWKYSPNSWLTVFLYFWSSLILYGIRLSFDDLKNNIAARAAGARLPPFIGDWTPGSIGLIIRALNGKPKYFADEFSSIEANTFTLRLLFQNRIITREPEQIKAMLATDFARYEKGYENNTLFNPLLGTAVFASDGDVWKFHRSMTRPFFTKDRTSDFDNFARHADETTKLLKIRFREGSPVDLQDMSARFTLDSATEFLFGHDVGSLSGRIPYPSHYPEESVRSRNPDPAMRFAEALGHSQRQLLKRLRLGFDWPLAEFWKDEMEADVEVIDATINPMVEEALARKRQAAEKGMENKQEDENLLDNLVRSTEDPKILRDAIMNLLVAGRDTTSSLISFVVYVLAEHPEVFRRVRTEILEQVGSTRTPSYEDIREMKYLRAVINETLRLYPPVPFSARSTTKQASLWPSADPNGKPYYLPGSTKLVYSLLDMHRRKDLWGPDALEFDPDRFIDDRLKKYLTPKPFIFLPFNAGPRICLGQQFAYNETSFFLIRLLQNFSQINLALDAQPPTSLPPAEWASAEGRKGKDRLTPKVHLTTYFEGGLWVKMTEADPREGV